MNLNAKWVAAALLALSVLPLPSKAQQPAPAPAAQQNVSNYRIAAGDVVDVRVLGEDQMSTTARVSNAGTIRIPFVADDLPVLCKTETEVAEAALAFSELWLAAPAMHRVVHADQMVVELCRLAVTVPFAHVRRQLRESVWVSGADCLLLAAARAAGDDEMLLGRVHQTGRALVGRQQLVASTALADELGL